MALDFTQPQQVARRPLSAQALLLKAISLPSVPLPPVDSRGSVALTPRFPMRGRAAEPAPEAEITFPQAEAGKEIAQKATQFKGINLAKTLQLAAVRSTRERAEKLAEPAIETPSETREVDALPEVPVISRAPIISPGPITQAVDAARGRSWGR